MLRVTVVYCPAAAPVWLTRLEVAQSATIRSVLEASGVLATFGELRLDELSVGVFSRRRRLDDPVRDGDRIEIYRPLIVDPKEARRKRAALKRRN